jgi:hypothetical protein
VERKLGTHTFKHVNPNQILAHCQDPLVFVFSSLQKEKVRLFHFFSSYCLCCNRLTCIIDLKIAVLTKPCPDAFKAQQEDGDRKI